MSADPQQDDEVLVLESMYELGKELIWESTAPREGRILIRGDGSVPEHDALWLKFQWPLAYPTEPPVFSLMFPDTEFLTADTIQQLISALDEEVANLAGAPATVDIIAVLGMRWSEFINESTIKKVVSMYEAMKLETESKPKESKPVQAKISAPKAEQQTKAQKRRANAQVDFKTGEKPRGWNWVDLISHVRISIAHFSTVLLPQLANAMLHTHLNLTFTL